MTIPCLTDFVSDSALRALTFEANVTPKPGLVDRNNVGAHPDMTLDMLIKSAEAISPYIVSIRFLYYTFVYYISQFHIL